MPAAHAVLTKTFSPVSVQNSSQKLPSFWSVLPFELNNGSSWSNIRHPGLCTRPAESPNESFTSENETFSIFGRSRPILLDVDRRSWASQVDKIQCFLVLAGCFKKHCKSHRNSYTERTGNSLNHRHPTVQRNYEGNTSSLRLPRV